MRAYNNIRECLSSLNHFNQFVKHSINNWNQAVNSTFTDVDPGINFESSTPGSSSVGLLMPVRAKEHHTKNSVL